MNINTASGNTHHIATPFHQKKNVSRHFSAKHVVYQIFALIQEDL